MITKLADFHGIGFQVRRLQQPYYPPNKEESDKYSNKRIAETNNIFKFIKDDQHKDELSTNQEEVLGKSSFQHIVNVYAKSGTGKTA